MSGGRHAPGFEGTLSGNNRSRREFRILFRLIRSSRMASRSRQVSETYRLPQLRDAPRNQVRIWGNSGKRLAITDCDSVYLTRERDSWHAPGRRGEFCHYALERRRAVCSNGRAGGGKRAREIV